MNQEEGFSSSKNSEKTTKDHYSNTNAHEHNEISNVYSYIDQKINLTLQNNSQSIKKLHTRLDSFEEKLQKQEQIYNEINNIKQQLKELKVQINNENTKLSQDFEEKVAKNSEQIVKISKIIDSQSELYETNYFDELKIEMKKLKKLLDSDLTNSQQHENIILPTNDKNSNKINNNQCSTDFFQEENHKIKSNLISIKSEIKRIITDALSKNDEIIEKDPFDEIQIDLIETSPKAQINNNKETESNEKDLVKQNSIHQFNISQEKYNEIKEKVDFLKNENELIKNDFDSFKSDVMKFIKSQELNQYNVKPNSTKIQSEDEITKIDQIIIENQSLKNDFNSFKSEIINIIQTSNNQQQNQNIETTNSSNDAQHKAIEATLTANEAQSKALEANDNSFNAQFKADDAVFRASEAESKAISANQKADLIVSDNNKMNVDIRCLKYEVKKLRSRVQELEKSENKNNLESILNEFSNRFDFIESKIKHLKCDFKKIKEIKSAESTSSLPENNDNNNNITEYQTSNEINRLETKILQFREDNHNLRSEVKTLRYEIKKIRDNLNASEVIAIPGDFIRQLNDAQNQSSHAYEKASKTHKEISDYFNKTNDIIEKFDKMKSELHFLKSYVRKMKGSQNGNDDEKTQKKDEKMKENNID